MTTFRGLAVQTLFSNDFLPLEVREVFKTRPDDVAVFVRKDQSIGEWTTSAQLELLKDEAGKVDENQKYKEYILTLWDEEEAKRMIWEQIEVGDFNSEWELQQVCINHTCATPEEFQDEDAYNDSFGY